MRVPPSYERWPSPTHPQSTKLRSNRTIRAGETILTSLGVAPQGIPLVAASSLVLNAQWLSDSVRKLRPDARRAVLALHNSFATAEENAWADEDKLGRRTLARQDLSLSWLQGLFKCRGIEDRRPTSERLWLFPEAAMIDHSCSPNTSLTLNWTSNPPIATLSALVDIPPDTVFTRPSARINLYTPFADRQLAIAAALGYSCACPACSSPSATSDERRASVPELQMACLAWLEGGMGDPVEICREGKRVLDEGGVMDQEGVQVGKTGLAEGLAAVAASVQSHFLLIADRGIDYAKTGDSARAGKIAALVKSPRSHTKWGKRKAMDLSAAWKPRPVALKPKPKLVAPAPAPAPAPPSSPPPAPVAPPPVEPPGPAPDKREKREAKKKGKSKKKAAPKSVAVEETDSASEWAESEPGHDPAPAAPLRRAVVETGWTIVDHSLPKQVVQFEPRALEGDELYYLRDMPSAPLSPPTSPHSPSPSPPPLPVDRPFLSARFPTRPNPTAAAPLNFLSSKDAHPLTPPSPQVELSDHESVEPAPSSKPRPPSPRAEIAARQLAKAAAEREQARMDAARPRLEEAAKKGGWGVKYVDPRLAEPKNDRPTSAANDQPTPTRPTRATGIVVKGGGWSMSAQDKSFEPLASTSGSVKTPLAPAPPAELDSVVTAPSTSVKLDTVPTSTAPNPLPTPLIHSKGSWRDRTTAAPARPKPAWAKPAVVAKLVVVETPPPVSTLTLTTELIPPVREPTASPPAPLSRSHAQSDPARSDAAPFATCEIASPAPEAPVDASDVLFPSHRPAYRKPDRQPFPLRLTSTWDSHPPPAPPIRTPPPPARSPSPTWSLSSIGSHATATSIERRPTEADWYGADVTAWRRRVAEAEAKPDSPPKEIVRLKAKERVPTKMEWAEDVEADWKARVAAAKGKVDEPPSPVAPQPVQATNMGGWKLPPIPEPASEPSLQFTTSKPVTLRGGWSSSLSPSLAPVPEAPGPKPQLSALAVPYETVQQSTLLGLLQPRVTVQDALMSPSDALPLACAWTLSFTPPGRRKVPVRLFRATSVLELCGSLKALARLGRLGDHQVGLIEGGRLEFFRDGERAVWEDPSSRFGGKVTVRVKEGRLSAVTLHLVLSLAGGGLNDEPGGRVLGLVACRRSKSGDRVELWIGLERGELCGEVQLEAGKRLRGWCERELDRYEVTVGPYTRHDQL